MNRYELASPRAAFGLAAVALTAITIGATVVLPAQLESYGADPYTQAATRAEGPSSLGAGINPARMDVPEADNRHEHVDFDCTNRAAQDSSRLGG